MRFRSRTIPSPAEAPSVALEARDVLPPEIRAPKAAVANLRFVTPGRETVPDWDAGRAIALAYYSNVFVYRCVQVRALALAGLPFRVGADPAKPASFRTNGAFTKFFGPAPGGPNPTTSARRLWAWSLAQKDITGRVGWEIEADSNGAPVAFWPLPGGSLWPIPSAPLPGQTSSRYFDGFKYGPPQKLRRLAPEQVFYDWLPSQNDWRQPESVLQAARLDVSVAVMQDRYDYAFLSQGATPASVIVHQAFAEKAERDAWREHFLAEHQGPDQAGKPVFVEVEAEDGQVAGMLDIKPVGLTQRDAEFIARYASKIRAITVAFGVPLSVLGDASNRTFSNADAEERFFWRNTMLPVITDLADAVNMQLAPRFGSDVGWFDTSGVEALRTAHLSRFTLDPVAAVAAGIFTVDDIRSDLGFPPMAEEPKPAPVVTPPSLPEAKGVEAVPAPASAPPPAPVPAVASSQSPEPRALPVDRQRRALERVWERQWRSMFRRQRDATLRRLEGKRGRAAVERRAAGADDLFDRDFWEAETVDFATGLYEAATEMWGSGTSDLGARAKCLARSATAATYDAIAAELATGVEAGEDVPKLSRRLRALFDEAERTRAPEIARAETSPPETRTIAVRAAERHLALVQLGRAKPEEVAV